MRSVAIPALPLDLLRGSLGDVRLKSLGETADLVRQTLGPRVVVNVNSTAAGGGVAEMLHSLLGYVRGCRIDVRWMVLDASEDFFVLTKQLHTMLHGVDTALALDKSDHQLYEQVLNQQAAELQAVVRPGDIVILHDPQTAGLARPLSAHGARVVWRCHIGTAEATPITRRGWNFLRPYLTGIPVVVSRRAYCPPWLTRSLCTEIAPSIDPVSSKNCELTPEYVREVLQTVGLLSGAPQHQALTFRRRDGTPGRIERVADVLQSGPPPPATGDLVLQVSRWDPLKDMVGVMKAFADFVAPRCDAHLLLAGPNVSAVSDDPEGSRVLAECMSEWRGLPAAVRSRVHLACLPMKDLDENGLLVNALQRAAAVVVQKSLAEGFGLTVTEAMWKARPVVGTRVGGIASQIVNGETGCLVDDPADHYGFANAVCGLLEDREAAARMGRRAKESARENFLPDRHLTQWAALVTQLLKASVPAH